MKYYAGIGSRSTPGDILTLMSHTGKYLEEKGYTLRSGGAKGADSFFKKNVERAEIFTSKSDIPEKFFELAEKYHPAWEKCNSYAKRLHARNGMILLGNNPLEFRKVDFILCWTEGGKVTGGTGQALRMASDFEIPIINFALYSKEEVVCRIKRFLEFEKDFENEKLNNKN